MRSLFRSSGSWTAGSNEAGCLHRIFSKNRGKQNAQGVHHFGRGVPQDYKEALRWYLKAAKQNNAHAQYLIGTMHEDGEGVPSSAQEALRWFRKAADQGHIRATAKLKKT